MSSHGLGISGVADDDDSAFDPLRFLADVAIQDARQDASLPDTIMQDAETQDANMQDAVPRDAAIQDADMQDAVSQDTEPEDANTRDADTQDIDTQDAAGPDTAEQGDAADGTTRQIVTAGEFLSMLEGLSSTTTDPSSSMPTDSNDEDANDEDSDGETDATVKGEPNSKGKSRVRKRKTAEERRAETAARVATMVQQRAGDEQVVLEEMRQDAEINRLAATTGTGSTSLAEIEATGILPDDAVLIASLLDQNSGEYPDEEEVVLVGSKRRLLRQAKDSGAEVVRKEFNLFTELSNYPELFMELAKHLHIDDLISLYAISKDFHETLHGHMSHILKAYAAYQAPESSRVFVFTMYGSLCIRDPVGRPDPWTLVLPRLVPSLRWLRMVIHREKCVRDILACMAREGHRMPKTMSLSIKKMWLTMDIPTSARRVQLMHSEQYWTDNDLYNMQMLFVKLDMRFTDPIEGPGDDGLRKLMLGQRGLTPLCQLLKRTRFTDSLEVLEACIRYSYWPRPEHRSFPIFGVPADEVGRGHLEGWGVGRVHLYRMDELVMRESCRRNMNLKSHIYTMIAWGYVDAVTGENIKVTKEEMYMSDDDDDVIKKKKKKRQTHLYGGGRKTKKDKGKGKERKDTEGPIEKGEKGQDGQGDTRMAA